SEIVSDPAPRPPPFARRGVGQGQRFEGCATAQGRTQWVPRDCVGPGVVASGAVLASGVVNDLWSGWDPGSARIPPRFHTPPSRPQQGHDRWHPDQPKRSPEIRKKRSLCHCWSQCSQPFENFR
ncbi:MAG: hypothetical protein BJ554DRAFT_7062, partial [Olpidium bornovanus]